MSLPIDPPPPTPPRHALKRAEGGEKNKRSPDERSDIQDYRSITPHPTVLHAGYESLPIPLDTQSSFSMLSS
jgi:hypothetical protein